MGRLKLKTYHPAVRAAQYDLLALNEIEPNRKQDISPILSIRGKSSKLINNFAEKWGETPCWIDSSRFPKDVQCTLSMQLNDQSKNFAQKQEFFKALRTVNSALLPVIGFSSSDRPRHIVQFALSMLDEAPYIAIRLEGAGAVLDKNINHVRAVLNAVPDADFQRMALIVDRGSIASPPTLQEDCPVTKCLELITEFPVQNVITLSTSWPDERPNPNEYSQPACMDPGWQARAHKMYSGNTSFAYGDYAATNPLADVLDGYDPRVMSQPIPFAGYFAPLYWHQERRGSGGENDRYRDIANVFRTLPDYHQDDFCWGTTEIAAIASGTRTAGNMAYWNKIRVNQHICAMLEALKEGLLEDLVKPTDDDEFEDLF